jgi:SAM-dependent methyltransferase
VAFVRQTPQGRLHPPRSWPWYIHLTDVREAMLRRAPEVSGRILDYGCGMMPYAALFRNATSYVGADFPDNTKAHLHLDGEGRLPADAGDYDAVISTQVLEHVPDVSLYLSECRRVLAARKGVLVLTTHGIWEYHPNPQDLFRWTHEGLVTTLERHGFETRSIEPLTTGLRALFQVCALMLDGRGDPAQWPRGVGRFVAGRPHIGDGMIVALNWMSDHVRQNSKVEAFRDFPLGYQYVGKVR